MALYLLRLTGEIALKGRKRGFFESKLASNIQQLLEDLGVGYKIERIDGGRILIYSSDEVSQELQHVFGIIEIMRVREGELGSIDTIAEMVYSIYCRKIRGKTYSIKVRRIGTHNFTSIDVARYVGSKLQICGGSVDLENPDLEIYIEIRDKRFFITSNRETIKAYGGLPLGVSEKVLSLFSGGFDSTVASWLIMRKGSPIDFIHIALGSADNIISSLKVAEKLAKNWSIGYKPKTIVIDGAELSFEIRNKLPPHYWQIALRRAMYEVSSIVMEKLNAKAIVTGESIWEASSQTLTNLDAAQKGLDINILRPVIAFDKDEIIDITRLIGTYELNNVVKESCFLGSYPHTHINRDKFLRYYSNIDKNVIDRAIENSIEINLYSDWASKVREWLGHSLIEIENIPPKAVIVDINRIHGKGSIKGLKDIDSIDRDREIVLVCEEGEASYTMARILREKGFRAYSLSGGYKRLEELGLSL